MDTARSKLCEAVSSNGCVADSSIRCGVGPSDEKEATARFVHERK